MTLPARPAKPTVLPTKTTGSVFSRLDFPTREEDDRDRFAERDVDAANAMVAQQRRLSHRLVQDGERTYHAYSADELMEIDSQAHLGRPGMPY